MRAKFLSTTLTLYVLVSAIVLSNVVLAQGPLRDESPPAQSHEILWEKLGRHGVFGVFVLDTMNHAVKEHRRLCGRNVSVSALGSFSGRIRGGSVFHLWVTSEINVRQRPPFIPFVLLRLSTFGNGYPLA